jgi:spore maturation protein CgeB
MKVLLFAARFHGYQDAIGTALRQHGAEVALHSYRPFGDRVDLVSRLLGQALPRCGVHTFVRGFQRAANARFLRLVRTLRPDLVLVVKGEVLTVETLRRAREISPGTVLQCWFMDMLRSYPQVEALIPCYDRFFTYSLSDQERQSQRYGHVEWLPLAFDPEVYRPRPLEASEVAPEVWMSFIGRVDRQRIEVLRPAVERVQALGGTTAVFGGSSPGIGWLRRVRRYDPFTLQQVTHRTLSAEHAARLYHRSRTCLNVHGAHVAPEAAGHIGHNMRFFEICGAGALQIVDRVHGSERLCEPGHDVLEYEGQEGLMEQLARALNDRELRTRIARNGHARALAHHTFAHRAVRFLEAARSLNGSGSARSARRSTGTAPARSAIAR